jgi:hypothetical protein
MQNLQKEKKEEFTLCIGGCDSQLKRDHTGVRCPQGHDICPDCSQNFVSTIMESPEANLPVKCMMCHSEVIATTFERQLNIDSLNIYLLYCAMLQCDPKDVILSCPFCTYYIFTPRDHSMNLFYCPKGECSKGSCTVCSRELPVAKDDWCEEHVEVEVH